MQPVRYYDEEVRRKFQRPGHYADGLRSRPWWPRDEFKVVHELEKNFGAIKQEFIDLVLTGRLKFHPESPGGPRKALATGAWKASTAASKADLPSWCSWLANSTMRIALFDARPIKSTNPICSAFSALMVSPRRVSSKADESPTRRGRRCVPPPPGMTPRVISGNPKTAFSAAILKSQLRATSQPPPKA